ncbi:hypothetical protein ANO14919_120760 [Xylariales sp. No.14919]|nr:hypothetical protein ANO14919_120760 [Xylariales sp. No.14919]
MISAHADVGVAGRRLVTGAWTPTIYAPSTPLSDGFNGAANSPATASCVSRSTWASIATTK